VNSGVDIGGKLMIDFHTHLGDLYFPNQKVRPLSADQLVDTMNKLGIYKSVLLPIDSPEAANAYFTTAEALEAWNKYPERFIPFCAVDPRRDNVPAQIDAYIQMGCKGFGEHKMGLAIDDERCKKIYRICGEKKLVVLFHLDPLLNIDEAGLPRLESLLKEMSDTIFIMHGPGWWTEVSAGNTDRGGYPTGKINPNGRADILLQEYPNLYADLSAGSAHNALTRDPEWTPGFLERNWTKLLFATDYLHADQDLSIVQYVNNLQMDEEKVYAIKMGNAMRLLNIPESSIRKAI
jgi:predicted TIM-barrel fold metal-dependent hydrolase